MSTFHGEFSTRRFTDDGLVDSKGVVVEHKSLGRKGRKGAGFRVTFGPSRAADE